MLVSKKTTAEILTKIATAHGVLFRFILKRNSSTAQFPSVSYFHRRLVCSILSAYYLITGETGVDERKFSHAPEITSYKETIDIVKG